MKRQDGGGRGYGVDQGREEGPGRRKKVAVEPTSDSDDEKREVELKVVALSDDVKRRFGQVVWAKKGWLPAPAAQEAAGRGRQGAVDQVSRLLLREQQIRTRVV
ncbi:hypothetical protein PF002_g27391 [Phytophthora fragariae]|uniref:Uncharacterized protein n=2 Tax=Phytophthora fragariae TaxID=53985 RepID=A0A6A3DVT0_9STRA|nr:hypothetical protein PF009_g27171 [Phytophthora fragariae]KAE9181044.1 hypothetical protein PF002_g27391 [Phytophthora fragariae]